MCTDPSPETASNLHLSFGLRGLSSSFPHPIIEHPTHGSTELQAHSFTLSSLQRRFKGVLRSLPLTFPQPASPFREGVLVVSPKTKSKKVRDARREATRPTRAPPRSPTRLLPAPPTPAGDWRSGEVTCAPREAPRGAAILPPEVAPLPAGSPGLLPPSPRARASPAPRAPARSDSRAPRSAPLRRPGVTQAEST